MRSRLFLKNHFESVLAALLLLVLVAELGFSVRRQSQTFDEAFHIYAGYRHWQCGDFGINPEHPPLAKLVATIPLLFDRPKNPGSPCATDSTNKWVDFELTTNFLYSNNAGRTLAETRLFIASFTLLLALLVFVAARRMFGGSVALIALLLAVFEPSILGHGALVTTDLAETCCFFAAVYAFYCYTEKPTKRRLIFCGLAAGFALVAKHSGVLLFPVLTILAVADGWIRWRASAPQGFGGPTEWKPYVVRQIAALAVIFALAATTLWGFYRFRYSARPAGHAMTQSFPDFLQDSIQNRQAHSVMLSTVIPRLTRLLPESYLYGLADITTDSAAGRPAFILGHLYPTGQWFYFPVVFLIKCTLGFLGLLVLTPFAFGNLWSAKRRETLFLLVPVSVYFGVSMTSHLNFGVRHILPVYPFLIVLAAAAAWQFTRQWRVWRYTVIFLVVFHCASSLRAFPHYLSYSNELWGGAEGTYRYLADTNADWGQGLIEEREYLARNRITDCWIAYNGTADLDYYDIPCSKRFPDYFTAKRAAVVPQPIEGTLLISVFTLSGWDSGPAELNPYAPLWHMKPVANLGGHTLVFQGSFDLPLLTASSHSRMAVLFAAQERSEEALVEARMGVKMDPLDMDNHLTLAEVLTQAKQYSEARSEYVEAIRLSEAQGTGYRWSSIGTARGELAALMRR
jgi:hypothetical protein